MKILGITLAYNEAEGNPDGVVIAVDKNLSQVEARPLNVAHIFGDTTDDIIADNVRTAALHRPFDLVFFDSTHSKEHASAEFELYDPLCASGAIQFFDDVTESDDMKAFWEWLPKPKMLLNELHPKWGHLTPGFGVRIKP